MPTLLKPDCLVKGDKAAGVARVLIDTGAEINFIRRALAEQLGTLGTLPRPVQIFFGDESKTDVTDTMTDEQAMAAITEVGTARRAVLVARFEIRDEGSAALDNPFVHEDKLVANGPGCDDEGGT